MDLKFPDVGEGITEGVVISWKVKIGDTIRVDDILAEVETDKAIVEWPSTVAGVVKELRAKEGETIKVGQVVVVIEEAVGKNVVADKNANTTKLPEKFESTGVIGSLEIAKDEEHFTFKNDVKIATQRVKALPATREVARKMGVDIDKIKGSGSNGMVTLDDVLVAKNRVTSALPTESHTIQTDVSLQHTAPSSKSKPSLSKPDTSHKKLKYNFFGHLDYVPFKGTRKSIADHVMQSHLNTASVTHCDEADITELIVTREREKRVYEPQGIKLTPLAFIVKALCLAIAKHPLVNSTIKEEDIVIYKYVNCGIAVDTPDGLLVPVIVKAHDKSIVQIAKNIQDLAGKARERKLDIAEMKNGTITITNYGSIGGIFATPIINYPEVCIIGLGKARDVPVVREGKIYARTLLPLSITFDHRVLDGAEIARFTNTLKEFLEDPDRMLVEEK